MARQKKDRKEPERVTATDAYRNFAAYVARAQFGGERFIITQHGDDAVAVIPARDLALLSEVA